MEKTKILIVANDFTTVYNFRLELLKALLEENYSVTVALPPDERNNAFSKIGCEVKTISLSRFGKNPLRDLQTTADIIKLIKSINPRVVLNFTAKPNIYGGIACRFTKTPYICNVTGLGSNFQTKNLVGEIMIMLYRFSLRKASVVFFQNQSNLDYFVDRRIVRSNAQLLPGSGFNLQQNPYNEYPDNQVPKFITVSRIRKDKGFDELFEAISRFYNRGGKAQFTVVGWYEDEKYRDTVEKLSKDYGVLFYENMPHEKINGLISECDCLIHPSHHEGLSNVILEAAAAGRPCIVSDISGCREPVENGKTGLYFAVKNSDSLYSAINAMLALSKEDRAQMGKNARLKVESQFDRNIVIAKYFEEIKKW